MASPKQSENVQQCNKEFFCTYDDCLKKFSSLSHLNRHEDIHKNKTYWCKECNAVFKSQYAKKRHVDNIHLKKTPKMYKCDYCEENFNKKSWLTRHIFKHTGIKPYMCTFEDCDAKFLVPSKLKRHLKMHEGYTCPKENCNEKFVKWTEVRRHLIVAHPKVYKCPECDQVFARSNNLKSHLVVHKTDRHVFLCTEEGCHRFYSKKYNLIYHITNYHKKRAYKCAVGKCYRAFESQEDLDAHISKHNSSGRLKKKRKKSKPKPSFAEQLAGLAPKKWQVDVLKDVSKSDDEKPSLNSSSGSASIEEHNEHQDEHQEHKEHVAEAQEILLLSNADENCDKVSHFISDEERDHNNLNIDSYCNQNDDIQTLLNIIDKRKGVEAASVAQEAKYISIEA